MGKMLITPYLILQKLKIKVPIINKVMNQLFLAVCFLFFPNQVLAAGGDEFRDILQIILIPLVIYYLFFFIIANLQKKLSKILFLLWYLTVFSCLIYVAYNITASYIKLQDVFTYGISTVFIPILIYHISLRYRAKKNIKYGICYVVYFILMYIGYINIVAEHIQNLFFRYIILCITITIPLIHFLKKRTPK